MDRTNPEFYPPESAPIPSDNLSSCLCLVHPVFGRPRCVSAPNLQLQQFDRLSILALASLWAAGQATPHTGNKTSENPPSPLSFMVESQPGGAGDRNVKKTYSFRGPTQYAHLAKCFCSIVETTLMSFTSDEPCRRDEEHSERRAPKASSREQSPSSTPKTPWLFDCPCWKDAE